MTQLVQDEITLPAIPESTIAGYRVFRSPVNHTRFNVVAVDANNNPLFVFQSDLTIDEASAFTDQLNQPFQLIVD